jgi:hypothetical protein
LPGLAASRGSCARTARKVIATRWGRGEIYRRFDLSFGGQAEGRMGGWLAGAGNHSAKAKFTLVEFGLDEALVERPFSRYLSHYGIRLERP